MKIPGRSVSTFGLGAPAGPRDWGLRGEQGEEWLVQGNERAMPISRLRVNGRHNAANALAALALTRAVGLPLAPLTDALAGFTGLPHRMQKVASVGGVTFYDDSKGTNVGATVAGLRGMTQPVVLIAGGVGKQQNFAPLAPAVREHARAVVLIGRDADAMAEALAATGAPLLRATDMHEAVTHAFHAAKPGDAVLMSPACASFDMFRNYGHRAEVFVAAVHELEARHGRD
jgi:UDP-N-acetylmuramoylalanine--D-glutamate ligase